MIEYIPAFGLGAVAGSAAAYIFVDRKYKKQISKHEEEIASIKEYTKRQIESYKNEAMKAEKKYEMAIGKEEEKLYSKVPDNIPDRVRTDYSSLAKEYSSDEEDEEEDKDDTDELEEDEAYLEGRALTEITNSKKGPELIYPEEFGDVPSVETQTLYYYIYDGILANEEGEIIDDAEAVVGDLLESSGFTDDSSPSIYIRNLLLGSDYEITKVFSGFGEH